MRDVAVRAENVLASLAMTGVMLLPLSEIVSRKVFQTGLPGPGHLRRP